MKRFLSFVGQFLFTLEHHQVKRRHLCEAYMLNELTGEAKLDYLLHVQKCEECAADLEAAFVFVRGMRS